MKHFITIAFSLILLILATNTNATVGSSLKVEGSCSGTLNDGSPVSFTYYSDFDGCKNVSKSAITFTSGIEGLFTGSRSFKLNKDIYNFPAHKVTFENSTGNTSGTFEYRDADKSLQNVELACTVRDYEYADC